MSGKAPPSFRSTFFGARPTAPSSEPDPDVPPDPDAPVEPDAPPDPEPPAAAEPPESAPPPSSPTVVPQPASPLSFTETGVSRARSGVSPAIGEVIDLGAGAGSYQLLKRLGRGGMGEVWLARRNGPAGFQREVAIKRIRADRLLDEDEAINFRNTFLDEARTLAALQNDNIAQVYDLQERGDGDYYLVMEYVPGQSAREILSHAARRQFRLSVPFACYVIHNVAEALHYAYTTPGLNGQPLRIVHRDATPQNIMIATSGAVKLIDFGVAFSQLENRAHTRVGDLKGIYAYMSPEQAQGARTLDTRSDLFTLGTVLCELLTGQRPFDAGTNSDSATLSRVDQANPADVDSVVAGLDEDLADIIHTCLAKDPDDRFDSGHALAEALRAYLESTGSHYSRHHAVEELALLADTPDVNATNVQARSGSLPSRPITPVGEAAAAAAAPPRAAPPMNTASSSSPPPPSGPSATRIAKRAATRQKLLNPQDPKPRLIKPALLLLTIAIGASVIAHFVIKLNTPSEPKVVEVVKTDAQKRAEREADARAQLPTPTQAKLADVSNPNAVLNENLPGYAPEAKPAAAPALQAASTTVTPRPAARVAQGGFQGGSQPALRATSTPTLAAAPPAPPPVRHRSLDTSTAVAFSDQAPSTNGPPPPLPKGTLVPSRLNMPVDPNNPGPVTATVTKPVSSPNGSIAIPTGSTLVCASGGSAHGGRVQLRCDGVNIGGRVIALNGLALGSDQTPGLPTGTTGGAGAGEPAKNTSLETAGRVAGRVLTGSGVVGDIVGGAVGATTETIRRGTSADPTSATPAPKGTTFLLFLNSFGGSQ